MTTCNYKELERLALLDQNISALLDEGKIIIPISTHAESRKKEREINDFMIAIALYYGDKEKIDYKDNKNNIIKFELLKNSLANTVFFKKYSKKLEGLVVITNSISRTVITTYFNDPIPNNERTYSEDLYYRKIGNKKHKILKNYLKGLEELNEY